jgi:hypothetical protein
MTTEQYKILRAAGWRSGSKWSGNCRRCHEFIFDDWNGNTFSWLSPKGTLYHRGCMLRLARVIKLLEAAVSSPGFAITRSSTRAKRRTSSLKA